MSRRGAPWKSEGQEASVLFAVAVQEPKIIRSGVDPHCSPDRPRRATPEKSASRCFSARAVSQLRKGKRRIWCRRRGEGAGGRELIRWLRRVGGRTCCTLSIGTVGAPWNARSRIKLGFRPGPSSADIPGVAPRLYAAADLICKTAEIAAAEAVFQTCSTKLLSPDE